MAKKRFFSILMGIASFLLLSSVLSLCFFLYRNRFSSTLVNTKLKNPRANVLFLSSMPNSYVVKLQKKGIRNVFLKNNINVDVEYFEPDDFYDKKLPEFLKERVKFLQQETKYDVVLVSGNNSCNFVERNSDSLFAGIPIVFFCIESNIRAERLYEKKNFWGIGTTRFLADTISVARKLFPSAEHYVAIYDKSDASYENYNVFINASEKIPNIEFSGIDASAFTKSQIARQLSALDDKTVVFYLGASKDADGIKYSMEEQANFIINNTSAPVFSHNANGVGFGFLGGKMVDYEKAGALAAKIVLDIIDGEKYIPFQRIKDGKFIFDYKIIEERKLNLSAFPLDSVFVNIHDQMQKNRRGVLFGMIGVAVSLFIFIAVSLILIISQVKDSYELRRSNLKM